MKHYGDITNISGYDVPPVDVVIGGSPCQDLSIAGTRRGLAGERSGLFMEQIRIVKEMRDADRVRGFANQYVRPRYMVWENVPGAFSSNRGEDFRAVLEETARVANRDAVIPRPEGGWRKCGCILGDGWSIAWRVLDAQFWGVPQRRRRIALIADFGGHAATEVLFIRKGVCGDTAAGGAPGEETARGIEGSFGKAVTLRMRAGREGGGKGALIQVEKSGALSCKNNQTVFCQAIDGESIYPAVARSLTARYDGSQCIDRGPEIVWCLQGNGVDRPDGANFNGSGYKEDISYTLNTVDRHAVCAGFKPHAGAGAGSVGYAVETAPTIDTGKPMAVFDARGNGGGEISCTLTGDHQNRVTDYTALVVETGQANACAAPLHDLSPTLNCNHEQPIVARGLQAASVAGASLRRLTPLECERLQGYPDGWTDIGAWTDSRGKPHRESSDAARYKALGNSIALPPWTWVLKRLCAQYERSATMASLFDGIGGFPLIWEQMNGPGTCLWASEIEEFPVAVTKRRFAKEGGGWMQHC